MKILIGRKISMSQEFTPDGNVIPVTAIKAGPCYITDIKIKGKDGATYTACRLGFEEIKKTKNVSKPYAGIFEKLKIPPLRYLKEFRFRDDNSIPSQDEAVAPGKILTADVFAPGDFVDVTGKSRGRGFSGVMKRHNFQGQPASHGASDRERAPGSSGRQLPQRVIKGTKKAGRYGSETVTIQRLEVIKVDKDNNIIMVKGAVPGPRHGIVYIKKTVKKVKPKVAPPVSKKKVTVESQKKKK